MKKDKGLRIVRKTAGILTFLVLLFACTVFVMRTTKDKGNYLKYQQFYEENENFDVLFFGSSRMLDAVYPMELWAEYGLTSYNMAQHAETLSISYWQMKNAFAHNTPKVAVVDLSIITAGKITDDDVDAKSYLHKSIDHMPFGKLKYDAIKDLTEGVNVWEYLVSFSMYHNRWNELGHVDFYVEDFPLRKGAESRVAIRQLPKLEWSSDEVATYFSPDSIRLNEMIELCKEYGVELVFTLMPSVEVSGNPDFCALANAMEVFAKSNEVGFVNFAKNDDFINYEIDFYDASHLNPSGGKKLTKKLGQFLTDSFSFDAKSEETIEAWNTSLETYMGTKLGELMAEQREGDIVCFLLLLNDDDYSFKISMPDSRYIETYGISAMLDELNISTQDILFETTEGYIEVEVYRKDREEAFIRAIF